MRSAEAAGACRAPGRLRFRRIAIGTGACVLLAVLAGCAGLQGKNDAADTGAGNAAAKNAQPAAAAQKPALIPDLDPAVISGFEAALADLHEGRKAEAEKGFLALAKAHPELGGPHANLGIIYRETGRPEQAIAELELATRCNPQQPVFWNQLGIAYRQQGQFAKARDAYEHAIAIDPAYPAPTLNLGILFDLYLWDGERALELYDRYLTLTPGGDPKVVKWVADLKNRNRAGKAENRKEKE
jgi:Flp pilus assembly protein TadD